MYEKRGGYAQTANGGYRAWAYGKGRKLFKRFKRGEEKKARNWVRDTGSALDKLEDETPAPESIAEDVERYLRLVAAMPTYAQRQAHLDLWIAALGSERKRKDITASDIRAVLQGWRLKWSAATCNKLRTALMHLWSVLDGKGAQNPVRDVPKFRVDDPLPRGRDQHEIDAKLLTRQRSRMRACARVLLWTGMRPVELERAEADDLDLKRKTVIARTAKGGRTRTIPLTPQAVSAWQEFITDVGWTRTAAAGQRVYRVPQTAPFNVWLKKATGLQMRVYDLRHSYGTALARAGTRLDVIAALMGHSTLELARRYVLAAVQLDAVNATTAIGKKRRQTRQKNDRKR